MHKDFEEYRFDMIEQITKEYKSDGVIKTQIPNFEFYILNAVKEQTHIMYEPSLCVILQGEKAVNFGNEHFTYNSNQFLISSAHLPAIVKIVEASNEKPYISFALKFSLEDIYEVLKTINLSKNNIDKQAGKGLFLGEMNIELYESIYRLTSLLKRDKDDIEFLSPLLIKEILYNLIKSQGGYFLTKFSMEGTVSNKIAKVISEIKNNFTEKLNVRELANNTDMSESSLYQHFKTITSLSPIQFQKQLRLEEAKQLLLLTNIEIGDVAFQVGYESASQFSREFTRMFGTTPSSIT
jgi:AraC-like DNA-binding protein